MNKKTCTAILTDRNDDYKTKDRFIYTINSHLDVFDEIIFIDYNTPKGKKPFIHEIQSGLPKTGKLKNILITPEIAKKLCSAETRGIEVINSLAYNIGIRRASSDFVVVCATDIFGPQKIEFDRFVENCDERVMYTFSRRELEKDELFKYEASDWKRALEHFSKNSVPRYYTGQCTPGDWYSIINCCGDFQLAPKTLWETILGYEEKMIYRNFNDTNVQKKAILKRFRVEAIYDIPIFHVSHDYKSLNVNVCMNNDPMYWVEFFSKSENTNDWGFPNMKFEMEIL